MPTIPVTMAANRVHHAERRGGRSLRRARRWRNPGVSGDIGTTNVEVKTFAYDNLNRMVSSTGPGGTESFGYAGAEWHRTSMTANGATTQFVYDGDNVVADVQGGNIVASYVTPFLDQNVSMTIPTGLTNAGTYYYSQDGLGSVRTLTNSSGVVVNKYDYAAFGETYAPNTAVTVQQRYTYTERELNGVSGLMDLRWRGYDPVNGRFLQRDPAGYENNDWGNLYDYVYSSPTRWVDLFGLDDETPNAQTYDIPGTSDSAYVEVWSDGNAEMSIRDKNGNEVDRYKKNSDGEWEQVKTHGGNEISTPSGKRGEKISKWSKEAQKQIDAFNKDRNKSIGKLKKAIRAIGILAAIGVALNIYETIDSCKECDPEPVYKEIQRYKAGNSSEIFIKTTIMEYINCITKAFPEVGGVANIAVLYTNFEE